MRLLFLCHAEIYNPFGGAAEYIQELVLELSKEHYVDAITWDTSLPYDIRKEKLHIMHFSSNRLSSGISTGKWVKNSFLRELLSIFGFDYYRSIFTRTPIANLNFRDLQDSYNLIIVISFESPKLPLLLSRKFNAPVIEMPLAFGLPWYLQNSKEWLRFIGRRSLLTSAIAKIIMRISNLFVEILEIHRLSSDHIIAISMLDAVRMSSYLDQRLEYLNPTVSGSPKNYSQGTGWENLQAMFFSTPGVAASISVEYILKISESLNSISFVISGAKLKDEVLKYAPKNVKFLGWLDSVEFEQVLKSSHIVLIPSIQGSGVQTKLLKALSLGKAVITTSAISRAFKNLENGTHLLIEDDPSLFIERIRELASNAEKIRALGNNAYQYYVENFTPVLTANKFMEIVRRVLSE